MIAELLLAVTVFVAIMKVIELASAETVTAGGTVANDVLLLARLICTPPAGAGLLSRTVVCEEVPPLTVLGNRLNEDNDGGFTISVADKLTLP